MQALRPAALNCRSCSIYAIPCGRLHGSRSWWSISSASCRWTTQCDDLVAFEKSILEHPHDIFMQPTFCHPAYVVEDFLKSVVSRAQNCRHVLGVDLTELVHSLEHVVCQRPIFCRHYEGNEWYQCKQQKFILIWRIRKT